MAAAVLVPHGADWEGFGLFLQGEAGGVIAGLLGFAQADGGLKQALEEGAQHVAGADDPGGDAVDAGIEIIEADVDALQESRSRRSRVRWQAGRRSG